MNRYSLTPSARRDLRAIWLFIASDSIRHADLVEDAILSTCRLAADNPEIGHGRDGIGNPGILFLTVTGYPKYQIAYARGSRSLRVLRILHGARNIPELFR